MSQVMLENAGSQLAHLVEQVHWGQEVIILNDSTLVAKLVPLSEEKPKERQGGLGGGKYALIYTADDFDAPQEDFKDCM